MIRTVTATEYVTPLRATSRRSRASSLNDHLGMRLLRAGGGTATVELTPQPWFRQEDGVVHGGILTTLADTAAVYAVESPLATIELKVNFLAPAGPRGRRGSRIAVAAVDVRQDGDVVLTGLFTYMRRAGKTPAVPSNPTE